MKNNLAVFLAFALLLLPLAAGHESALPHQEDALNPGAGLLELAAAALGLVLLLGAASAIIGEGLGRTGKRIAFWAIAAVSVGMTLYLIGSIALLFSESATGGPVHWHADFEVWVCGERISLKKAEGWSTRVGPLLLHHHGDDRLHVEGVVRDKRDVSLGEFFEAIEGGFTSEALELVDESGARRLWRNGEPCPDGRPSNLKLFVNGVENAALADYVISPQTDVPPGDVLKIVFGPD